MQEYKVLVWIRWVGGIIVAASVAVLIGSYISRDNAIAACIRNSESKLIDAQFIESAEAARRASGDGDVADAYAALALSKRATIPMPDGWHGVAEKRGNSTFDRRDGCQDAFPAPIPFIE